jgi:hypothetical protein
MKKRQFFLFMILLTSTTFISCGSDDDGNTVDYADYTVEQNKQKIEEDGVAVVEELDAMKNLSGVDAIVDLSVLISNGSLDESYASVSKLLAPIAESKKDVLSLSKLRSSSSEIDGLEAAFDSIGGIYTYNAATGIFTRVASTSQITFIYPIGTSVTNNGQLTINHYTYQTATNADFSGEELLKTLDITLKSGTTTLIDFAMDVSYNSDDLPSAETVSYTFIEGYGFKQTLNYSAKNVSMSLNFTLDGSSIASAAFESDGNYSYTHLNDLSEVNGVDPLNNFLKTANAHVQLGNLKLTGNVNYSGFYNAFVEAFPDGDMTEETQANYEKLCEMLNKNVSVILMYADEKTAIAKSSFYVKETLDEYYDYYTQQYITDTYYFYDMRLVFKDDSTMDGSFFDTGFGDFLTAWQDFLTDMNSRYGVTPV